MHVGELVIVCKPWSTTREIHRNRIGMVVSLNNRYYSVKFADESLVSFYAKEIEIVTTPTAQSY